MLIEEEITKLTAEKVSDWELQRAKNCLTADLLYDLRSNDNLANAIGFYAALDCLEVFKTLPGKWNAVTADDVQRVMKQYFRKSNRTITYIVSTQTNEGEK